MDIIYISAGAVTGLVLGWWLGRIVEKNKLKRTKEDAEKILKEAKFRAEEITRKVDLETRSVSSI